MGCCAINYTIYRRMIPNVNRHFCVSVAMMENIFVKQIKIVMCYTKAIIFGKTEMIRGISVSLFDKTDFMKIGNLSVRISTMRLRNISSNLDNLFCLGNR